MAARTTSALAVGLLLTLAGMARAATLAPGGAVPISGVPGDAGMVIADVTTPFEIYNEVGALLYKGSLQDRVIKTDATGTLDFSFLIRDTQSGLNGYVTSVQRKDFAGYSTDVDFSTTSLGTIGPDRAKRTSDGAMLDFDFTTSPVYSGLESRRTYAITDATDYAKTGEITILLNEGSHVTISAFAPAVPEPAGLCVLALGCLGLFRRPRVM